MRFVILLTLLSLSNLFAEKTVKEEYFLSSSKKTANGIVFTDQRTGNLFISNGIDVEIISSERGSGTYAAVSPDRRFVGFKEVDENGIQRPVVYDAETKSATALHPGASRVGQVSFSNTGAVAFTVDRELFVVRQTSLTKYDLGTYANIAPISPDGNFAAFNDNADQINVIDLRSGNQRKITDGTSSYGFPVWSPNGSQLLFSGLNGTMFVHNFSSAKTFSLGEGMSPSWLDDGTILFSRQRSEQHILLSSELFTLGSGGAGLKQITFTDEVMEIEPQYDAATRTIYYSDVRSGNIFSSQLSESRESLGGSSVAVAYSSTRRFDRQSVEIERKSSDVASAAVYFEMPYVHQVWDTPDWYNGHSACGATASIMVIAYYNIVPKWNVWCSPSGSSPGHFSPYGNYVCEQYIFREYGYSATANDPNGKPSYGGYGFMWTGNFSPYSRTVDYYSNHGIPAGRFDTPSHESIIAEADAGYPYTLCNGLTTAGHIVVVNGYDANNRTLIVNDPYGNKNTGSYPSLNGKGVKYDWPGYNNGYKNFNTIFWGINVRYAKTAAADSLVDDSQHDKGFFLNTAAPSSLTRWSDRRNNGYNGHFWWTRTKMSDTCFATWTPSLHQEGMYEVFAYIPVSEATAAKYSIKGKDSTFTVIANQKSVSNNWLSLGIFPFAKGNVGYVRLGDGSEIQKQAIVFDAVKWSFRGSNVLSVGNDPVSVPSFSLHQNYPNPFNPSTIIGYRLHKEGHVSLTVFDALGRNVGAVVDEVQSAGDHTVSFDASSLAAGMYFYRLVSGNVVETKRMSLIK